MPPDVPLTRERVLATAQDVIRRYGPSKATVVDVARALGVSHTAVYKHVSSKAELRDLVVGQWLEATMPPLRAIVAQAGPAPLRLRKLIVALIAVKRRRAADDSELFTAYRTLAADAQSVIAAHVDEMINLVATIIASGVKDGTFRTVEPVAAGRAVLVATSKFHHRPMPPSGATRPSTRRSTTYGSCSWTGSARVRAIPGTPRLSRDRPRAD